jgi:NADH:ubiquinone oxidoreductase subunit 6 (subunit J)
MLDFMFLVFAGLAVFGALVVFAHPNIVHGVFGLVAALLGVGGLYWTLGADFLGATQLLLYVGGVTVLLLFAVMLSTRDSQRVAFGRYLLGALLVGLLGAKLVDAAMGVMSVVAETGTALSADPPPTTPEIGTAFLDRTRYLLPFEAISVLLLVVLVGAVTLVRRGPEGER